MDLYRVILYLCSAAVVVIIAWRWLRPRPRLGRARLINELIWTAIPALVLLWLIFRR